MPKGQALAKYTMDLTKRAKEGKLDPVIGRDEVSTVCVACSPVLRTS